jgi:hypothetical protein
VRSAPEQAERAVAAVADDLDQLVPAPEAASFEVVSSGAVPPGAGNPRA